LNMLNTDINPQFIQFLNQAPTPYHAVEQLKTMLHAAQFTELAETERWHCQPGGKYFVTRNDSSIIAFVMPQNEIAETGVRLIGAHTDSPCLRVKPQPEIVSQSYYQLGVEVYGGALLAPWFDRDLSLAGRVTCRWRDGSIGSRLLDLKQPIAVIPSLAIHLDREQNSARKINPQRELPPILWQTDGGIKADFRSFLQAELQKTYSQVDAVLDFELSFYDTQPARMVGVEEQFIAGARLDNLLSCFIAIQALIHHPGQRCAMVICNDHEEVGSTSHCGAQGTFLNNVLERLIPDAETRFCTLAKSLMVSADNAHGVHPNFADKHDANHGPLLNHGPVIKINANQRYATTSETAARFRALCEAHKIPVQSFVVRTDMACGSTIGPITSSLVGLNTLDVGVPTFAMHSIRELAGASDTLYFFQALSRFFTDAIL